MGGGALLFHLALPGSLAADSNPELVQFYEVVRDEPDQLVEAVRQMKVTKAEYYRLRALRPETLGRVECAARFLYLNKTCYNGLYRVNRNGQFNTPFGGRTNVSLVAPGNLHKASAILRCVDLVCADYVDVLRSAREGDFVYLDPPYLPLGGYSDFRRYTPRFFGKADHVALAREFRGLSERGVKALLSNAAHRTIENLYEGYSIVRVKATRQINCRADGRGQIEELLIANYPLEPVNVVP